MEELGEGTAAHVYKGRYRSQLVAIKILKESLDGKHKEDFQKELNIMSALRSPHVVFFFGACLEPRLAIVTELLENGSLYDIMTRKDIEMHWNIVINLCVSAARAINVLHCWKPSIVHRDLKPHNLLVDTSYGVKVSDFGLARFAPSVDYPSGSTDPNANSQVRAAGIDASLTKLRGTYIYAAPEVYRGQIFTTKADVYSFGIILWELLNRHLTSAYVKPYAEYKHLRMDFQIIVQVSQKNLRPTCPVGCPAPFKTLLEQCWDADPNQRPEFVDVIRSLQEIKTLYDREQQK